MRQNDFSQIQAVLANERPDRPTLFEFFLNGSLYQKLSGTAEMPPVWSLEWHRVAMFAYQKAGYDYAPVPASALVFPQREHDKQASRSMSETALISDRASFESYPWPDVDAFPSYLPKLAGDVPDGMKLIVFGPGGVLENVMQLAGYEPLCYMLFDAPELVQDLFDYVGSRLQRYYELVAADTCVGALIVNDDWGFNTQTMLPPEDMRRYVIHWHKIIVETIHAAGKPAILHSCGNLAPVMDDIIDVIGYDAKHSYEDNIIPVEDAYDKWGSRIAILGGMDLDFMCRSTPDAVTARCRAMIKKTERRGGYALGTGNSVPEYVPHENYFAMIESALNY